MQHFAFSILTVFLLCCGTQASKEVQPKATTSKESEKCKQHPSAGMPGIPGIPGSPGSPGRDGFKGEKGTNGKRGLPGAIGIPGKSGPRGPEGTKGEKGGKGESGTGISGNTGPRGPRGPKGENGIGRKGEKGDAANIDPRQMANWKQCAWQATTGIGKIKECSFNKLVKPDLKRRVTVRETFEFNGNECSGPMTIDSVLYNYWPGGLSSIHRNHFFEGYCENLAQGTVRVELWVGKCSGHTQGDAYTGWNSVSPIMIEELPPSQ